MLSRAGETMMLPWRRKIEAWLRRSDPSSVWVSIAALEGRMDRMNDKLDAVVKKSDEVEAYVVSVVDQVKTALDYLRAHQDAGVKEAADKIGESLDGIAKKLAELGASGGVA